MSVIETVAPVEVEPAREVSVGDVLERAADVLSEWEWGKRSLSGPVYCDESGTMCLLGAVYRSRRDYGQGMEEDWQDYHWAAEPLIASGLFARSSDVWVWNDETCQSGPEAVAKLREAARNAR